MMNDFTRDHAAPDRAAMKVIWERSRRRNVLVVAACVCAAWAASTATARAQPVRAADPPAASATPAAVVEVPADYVIGTDDVLSILFWREKDLSTDVTVRPDGKITVPLLNDVKAVGLTPEQLRDAVMEAAKKYIEEPNATVIVKQINSRKVFITGRVEKPGSYPLLAPTSVLQLIAMAGGLREFVDGKNISVLRTEGGKPVVLRFDYRDVVKQKDLKANIQLKPGDTVVVP